MVERRRNWCSQCGKPYTNKRACGPTHAAEYAARTLDAAPADPVVSAECWRRAIADIFGGDMPETVEKHATELAREGK